LVFSSRATLLPAPDVSAEPEPNEESSNSQSEPAEAQSSRTETETFRAETFRAEALKDVVIAAAQAAIPPDLLAQLQLAPACKARSQGAGRIGPEQHGRARGRPAGVCSGLPGEGARLSVIDTLRAAAPWQRVRRASATTFGKRASHRVRMDVRKEDFRIFRLKRRTQTTIVFLVDASGSAAMHRLAEVKGAIELLLADCYVSRNRVALITFRRSSAELLLSPTRSLARAKRCLAALAAGGGTPLACALDAASALAHALRHKGDSPVIVIMTDGNPNIARDGKGGRERAQADALSSARLLRLEACPVLLLDTAPQPLPQTARLAAEMAARYIPLPRVRADALSDLVRKSAVIESPISRGAVHG
jgi:magnesium chelatase subunit D